MGTRWRLGALVLAIAVLGQSPAASLAVDYGAAVITGDWDTAATWTPGGGPPGASDNVYIGSAYPGGSAATATVNLQQNESAKNVYVGYDAGGTGVLNLNGHVLTATSLNIGFYGGSAGTLNHGGGMFAVQSLGVAAGNSLTMAAGDTAANVDVGGGSVLTTAASGNISNGLSLSGGSTVNLGADLSLTGNINHYAATLDAQGHDILANNYYFGWYGGPATLLNHGKVTANNLYVGNGSNYGFGASDVVANLTLSGASTATTAAAGNIATSINVDGGSTLTLGADLALSSNAYVYNGTLDAAGHKITASTLSLGWYGGPAVLSNRGDLALSNLLVANQNFNLTATDNVLSFQLGNGQTNFVAGAKVNSLYLSNAAGATTSATGNILDNVDLQSGSTLTLGANLALSNTLNQYNATLDAQGHDIAASTYFLGWYSGPATLLNKAKVTATNFYVGNGTNYLFGASDVVSNLNLGSNATATTAATGNVAGNVSLDGNSTLTLGADLNLSSNLYIYKATLDAAGHDLAASSVFVGWYGGPAVLANRGAITANHLYVADQTFNLTAADAVTNFHLTNAQTNFVPAAKVVALSLANAATATTTATSNVSANVDLSGGSTLTLGADLSLSDNLDQRDATVDAQGHDIAASTYYVGWYGGPATLSNKGKVTANNLYVGNGTNFTFGGSDVVSNLTLGGGATATTAVVGNVTNALSLDGGSTLTLGDNLHLASSAYVYTGNLDAAGHDLTASGVYLGWYGGTAVLGNRGKITTDSLYVANQNFDIAAIDAVTSYHLSNGQTHFVAGATVNSLDLTNGATGVTSATSNITNYVGVDTGSTLTLGAKLALSGDIYHYAATLDAQGHDISAATYYLGWYGGPATLTNPGAVTVANLYVAHATSATLASGSDVVDNTIDLKEGSTLIVSQADGMGAGLTLDGTSAGNLSIDGTSLLDLQLGDTASGAWIFRWKDSFGDDWITELTNLISQGRIAVSSPHGYGITSDGAYTYIGYGAVPEPSSLALLAVGVGFGWIVKQRRAKSRGATANRIG